MYPLMNYELGINNYELTNPPNPPSKSKSCLSFNPENPVQDKIMLQTWFSDILVTNEDEG